MGLLDILAGGRESSESSDVAVTSIARCRSRRSSSECDRCPTLKRILAKSSEGSSVPSRESMLKVQLRIRLTDCRTLAVRLRPSTRTSGIRFVVAQHVRVSA
jgi:hypothetical protein